MSLRLLPLALDFGPEDSNARFVFLALSERAKDDGICWPSRDDICNRTRLSVSTVTRALRRLEKDGWLQRRKRFQSSNVFRLNVQRLLDAQADATRKPDVPDGFEAFPEEMAARERQAIENKDKGQADPHKGQPDPHKGQPDPVTCKEPSNNRGRAGARPEIVLGKGDWDAYCRERMPGETRQAWLDRLRGGVVPSVGGRSA